MELDYETTDDRLDEISKREATPKPQELVLQGLKIRQVPTSLNRLGLNARNIDIRQLLKAEDIYAPSFGFKSSFSKQSRSEQQQLLLGLSTSVPSPSALLYNSAFKMRTTADWLPLLLLSTAAAEQP
ncbi:hypothetical protein OOU_Y34scaffold01191g2 [Pyricularia oryzae Y34]|uniref:Uncharacterized protein n=1 Tax=Pyricularia oryzae (strain Y34) TaxID=1143189 RepID=A0AA97PF56_PYRO3|nr:hypothetical protein OOU_Y34scaffold01191g2 [Pyricularia oryzae Y34]